MTPVERLQWLSALASRRDVTEAMLRVAVSLAVRLNGEPRPLEFVRCQARRRHGTFPPLRDESSEGLADVRRHRGRLFGGRLRPDQHLHPENPVPRDTVRRDIGVPPVPKPCPA